MTREEAFRVLELYRDWNTSQKSISFLFHGVRTKEDGIYDERRRLMLEATTVLQAETKP